MSSNEGGSGVGFEHWSRRTPPPPAIARYAAPAEVEPVVEVWVLLERIVRPDADPARSTPDGLDYTGRARGLLKPATWFRSHRGLWLAYVNYEVHYADGRPQPRLFGDQVVPAYALQQRHDGRPLGGRANN